MQKTAVIVAAGSGSRMKHELPKQFLPLLGVPVLMHTIRCFHGYDSTIRFVVALPGKFKEYWQELCVEHQFEIKHSVVVGGETRFHTVKNCLAEGCDEGLVAIHDGVRPLVSRDTLDRCFSMAAEKGTAVPCIPVSESMRIQNDAGNHPVDRALYRLIQTPQVFRCDILKKAFDLEYMPEYTDDAIVVEKAGFPVNLVEGNPENIKITTASDLLIAEEMMRSLTP
ncbi:MAG: 2-C-methyl-D-erythritol 4-phosphate cytidylyltransferase [Bacteroidales bacterium]|nr:2-C-methyl-D-erythritol 4-phosphate cytidylyltransferase [Bacteroidales bacterium]